MNDEPFFVSRRRLFRVTSASDGRGMLARLEVTDPAMLERASELITLERHAFELRAPVLPSRSVEVGNDELTIECPGVEGRFQHDYVGWHTATKLIVGLCEAATLFHDAPEPAYLGPPQRGLLCEDGNGDLHLPFAAIWGLVHDVESNLLGAAMTMGDFKRSPEMFDRTPVADVFFLTQLLAELVTGREVYRHRATDYFAYVTELRGGPGLLSAAWPAFGMRAGAPRGALDVLQAGLAADPITRPQTPDALADLLREASI